MYRAKSCHLKRSLQPDSLEVIQIQRYTHTVTETLFLLTRWGKVHWGILFLYFLCFYACYSTYVPLTRAVFYCRTSRLIFPFMSVVLLVLLQGCFFLSTGKHFFCNGFFNFFFSREWICVGILKVEEVFLLLKFVWVSGTVNKSRIWPAYQRELVAWIFRKKPCLNFYFS